MIKYLLIQLRPQQWVKNGVVLAGVIFSGNITNPDMLITALLAAAVFCMISSTIYIINDLVDIKADRYHPQKARRPLASGKIKPPAAITTALVLGLGSLTASYFLGWKFFLVAISYVALNLLYSFFIKHIVLIDVMSIALGFVLRALAGAVVIGVEFSGWLLVSSFLLALFLGFGKRRYELEHRDGGGGDHRRILRKYSGYLLDQLIGVVTPAVVVCYMIYVISPDVQAKLGTKYLYLTTPFVIYGIFRYLYLIHHEEKGGSPTRVLLSDWPVLLTVMLWLTSVLILLYIV